MPGPEDPSREILSAWRFSGGTPTISAYISFVTT